MNDKISANYQLTRSDYIEAKQLYRRKSKDFIFSSILILFYVALILLSIYRFKEPDFLVMARYRDYYNLEQTNEERYVLIAVYLFALSIFSGKLFPKLNPLAYWNTKKDLQKNFVKQEVKQISITSEGIAIASQNYRQNFQWQAIGKTAENQKIFLLYYSGDRECIVIPKRIFSTEAELNNFRHLSGSQA